ncbi:hypothetical protein FYJ26_06585 [Anaerococcus sp. WCA-380-WT-2B]|uniref:Uncharacterized protein n=1 Tax=Anaerococcus porci TaxID=2652269 RepID=A0A6N7VT82_9FIRM|nr:hypothetical protein [Anaerococcus porci]MSS78066.1 hypothetical protein [Anaerococcus porci]
MDKKNTNLSKYFSYLPLAGSIVAVLISVLFYVLMGKKFQTEYLIKPIIYFAIFTVIGLFGTKYLEDEILVKNKNLIIILIIVFLIIQVLAYLKII